MNLDKGWKVGGQRLTNQSESDKGWQLDKSNWMWTRLDGWDVVQVWEDVRKEGPLTSIDAQGEKGPVGTTSKWVVTPRTRLYVHGFYSCQMGSSEMSLLL